MYISSKPHRVACTIIPFNREASLIAYRQAMEAAKGGQMALYARAWKQHLLHGLIHLTMETDGHGDPKHEKVGLPLAAQVRRAAAAYDAIDD